MFAKIGIYSEAARQRGYDLETLRDAELNATLDHASLLSVKHCADSDLCTVTGTYSKASSSWSTTWKPFGTLCRM